MRAIRKTGRRAEGEPNTARMKHHSHEYKLKRRNTNSAAQDEISSALYALCGFHYAQRSCERSMGPREFRRGIKLAGRTARPVYYLM